ncbi:hypothetical protein RND81_14G221300 [Saponaria officinalis]|uniref:Uncharacterized protein n=1 Tax=Saponaria officinalis TaxID=3572 RepID=A0AAW1GT30_SAPOF
MADIKSSGGSTNVGCDQTCGCPSPCPGDHTCRGEREEVHMKCSCGDHCGCNPCTCLKEEVKGTGKAFCKCGDACSCVTCAA